MKKMIFAALSGLLLISSGAFAQQPSLTPEQEQAEARADVLLDAASEKWRDSVLAASRLYDEWAGQAAAGLAELIKSQHQAEIDALNSFPSEARRVLSPPSPNLVPGAPSAKQWAVPLSSFAFVSRRGDVATILITAKDIVGEDAQRAVLSALSNELSKAFPTLRESALLLAIPSPQFIDGRPLAPARLMVSFSAFPEPQAPAIREQLRGFVERESLIGHGLLSSMQKTLEADPRGSRRQKMTLDRFLSTYRILPPEQLFASVYHQFPSIHHAPATSPREFP